MKNKNQEDPPKSQEDPPKSQEDQRKSQEDQRKSQEPLREFLFIGGFADGKRMPVEDKSFHPVFHTFEGQTYRYKPHLIGAPGRTWRVFVWDELGIEDAMESLFEHYNPTTQP